MSLEDQLRRSQENCHALERRLENQRHEIAEMQRQRDEARQNALDDMPPTVHWRRCFECGSVAMHADAVVPYVLCRKCGSQDTRRIKK